MAIKIIYYFLEYLKLLFDNCTILKKCYTKTRFSIKNEKTFGLTTEIAFKTIMEKLQVIKGNN